MVEKVDLNKDTAREILHSDKYVQAVRQEQNNFKQMGITSVPTFIINDKYALTGGQLSESFIQALKQISEEEAKQEQ